MDAMPMAGNHGNEVVVAMANVVVVVAEAKCGVQGRSGPDARALRSRETRRGVPGWLEGKRPLTSPQAFFRSVCSVVLVVKGGSCYKGCVEKKGRKIQSRGDKHPL